MATREFDLEDNAKKMKSSLSASGSQLILHRKQYPCSTGIRIDEKGLSWIENANSPKANQPQPLKQQQQQQFKKQKGIQQTQSNRQSSRICCKAVREMLGSSDTQEEPAEAYKNKLAEHYLSDSDLSSSEDTDSDYSINQKANTDSLKNNEPQHLHQPQQQQLNKQKRIRQTQSQRRSSTFCGDEAAAKEAAEVVADAYEKDVYITMTAEGLSWLKNELFSFGPPEPI
ncbi:hypothetical protein AQUCO_01000724v1 [Aquilegia coerulea]|uniref:Uncharacterized protein n=1 Tax=Aquilegia coerulea TaxID=218851 RepID=A0A2G5EBG7_AQUCA|nr:hypothetical protein AQUCO_01000724v1 [Aquilegia coerulea]